jgi:hypothetical protein
MATKVSEVVLKYTFDPATIAKTEQRVKEFNDTVVNPRVSAAIENIGEQFAKAAKLAGNFDQQAKDLLDTLQAVGASEDEIKRNVKQFEDLTEAARKAADQIERTGKVGGVAEAVTRARATVQAGGSSGGKLQQSIFSKIGNAGASVGLEGIGQIGGLADDLTDLAEGLAETGLSAKSLTALLGGGAVALAAYAVAVKLLNDKTSEGKAAADAATAANTAYFDSLNKTSKDITDELANRRSQQSRDTDELARLQASLDATFQAQTESYGQFLGALGDGAARVQTFADDVTKATGGIFGESQLGEARARAEALQKSLADNAGAIYGMEQALQSQAVATNDATAAEQRLIAERQRLVDSQVDEIRQRAETNAKIKELTRTGTREQLDAAITANQRQREIVQEQLNALSQIKEPSEAVGARIEALRRELRDLDYGLLGLLDRAGVAIVEFDKLKQSAEGVKGAVAQAASSVAELGSGIVDAILDAGSGRVKVEAKFQDDVNKLTESGLEKKIAIETRYADRQIEIAQQAADAAAKTLTRLKQQQADERRNLGRDLSAVDRKTADAELSARIAAAREDQKAFATHLANLQKIRADAQDREFQQGLDRDFGALFLSRRDTARQLASENSTFSAERQQRQADLEAKIADDRRAADVDRRERNLQYAARLEDAKIAYQRENAEADAARQAALTKAQQARQTELAQLDQSIAAQLSKRRAALKAEIDLINQGVAQRIKAETIAQTTLIQNASRAAGVINSIFNAVGSIFKTPVNRDNGGDLAAFQLARVNEPWSSGNETFSTGGREYRLPQNSLFLSSQAGMVNANKGNGGRSGATVSITNHISGAGDPQAVARLVDQRVTRTLEYIFGD